MTLISLFPSKQKNNEQKSLYKKTEPKKIEWDINKTTLFLIIGVTILFIIISTTVYYIGGLESTQYYYRIDWLI